MEWTKQDEVEKPEKNKQKHQNNDCTIIHNENEQFMRKVNKDGDSGTTIASETVDLEETQQNIIQKDMTVMESNLSDIDTNKSPEHIKFINSSDDQINSDEHSDNCEEMNNLLAPNVESNSPEVKSTPIEDENENWVHILGHDKLKKKVIEQGKGYFSRPKNGQVISIQCTGSLVDGTTVDKSEKLDFILGDGDVIQAFDLCLPLMELGETCILETDSKYAYGEQGRYPDIPSDAHITYEIELLNVEESPEYAKLPTNMKLKQGVEKRERGNWWYSRNDHTSAINSYNKALHILTLGENSIEEIAELNLERVKCYNNLGAAQLKIEAWDAAIKSCDAVIRLEPDNVKALFRKGKCLAGRGELEAAISVLRKVLKIEPETKIIHNELSRLVNKHKLQTQSAKEMYQRMMGTDKTTPKSNQSSNMSWTLYIGGAVAAACVSVGLVAYRYLHV